MTRRQTSISMGYVLSILIIVSLALSADALSGASAMQQSFHQRAADQFPATISHVTPTCVLRSASSVTERTLVVEGSNFPFPYHSLQFRTIHTNNDSILFDMEVNWQSSTSFSIDMDRIDHLLWTDPLIELQLRVIDTTNWSNWEPASDWSQPFLLADTQQQCTDGFPALPVLTDTTMIDVYVITFEPTLRGQPAITYGGWNQPQPINEQYIADVEAASGGTVRHRIVHQSHVDGWTPKYGGYTFNEQDYLACLWSNGTTDHCSTATDYSATLNTVFDAAVGSACEALQRGDVEEIWWWGGPWSGFYEYQIIAPNTLCPHVDHGFVVMGYNYERTVVEVLHDLGHRAERSIPDGIGLLLWNKFDGQRLRYSPNYSAEIDPANTHCGNVHFAPNATQHYIRTRDLPVLSDCYDWQHFPDLTGVQQLLNYPDWYGGDAQREMTWWLSRFPHNSGQNDRVYYNWWKYIYPWNDDVYRIDVALDGPPTGWVGATVSLTATVLSASNAPLTYTWDFGDGTQLSSDTAAQPHQYTQPGQYQVEVTATNVVTSATAFHTLSVSDVPFSMVQIAYASPAYIEVPTAFTATAETGTNVVYRWDFGDGSPPIDAGATVLHTYTTPTTYTVIVTASNTTTTHTDQRTIRVIDQPIEALVLTNASTSTISTPVTFTARATGGTNVTYRWDFGDGSPQRSGGVNMSYSYTVPGVYTVQVQAENSAGTVTAHSSIIITETTTETHTIYIPLLQ